MSVLSSRIATGVRVLRDGGLRAFAAAAWRDARWTLGELYLPHDLVYERDWDVLLILDACRNDLMRSVVNEYEFLRTADYSTVNSVATCTADWIPRNFSDEFESERERTVYVSGNPNSGRFLDPGDFQLLDEPYRYAWDGDLGTIPPRPVTDRAIVAARNRRPNRLVVHYMQPHYPFIDAQELGGQIPEHRVAEPHFGANDAENPWDKLESGDVGRETVWSAYQDNLRVVLDDIELLLENIEADTVVISSDHGNALGEWNTYGHPPDIPISSLKTVPWIETSASDSKSYEPSTERDTGSNELDEKLADLGYK